MDAAQLAPHVPIDMEALGIDHLALSGHKLYAPFGVGVLVARGERIAPGRAAPARRRRGRARARTTASSGTTRPRASRPARRTSSARSRSAPPATRSRAYGMDVLAARGGDARRAAARAPRRRVRPRAARAVARRGRPARRARLVLRPRLRGRPTSRAGWPRSTRSRCAPAPSAHIRSCGTCGVSRAAPAAAPCARASASAPASTTSMRSPTRWKP